MKLRHFLLDKALNSLMIFTVALAGSQATTLVAQENSTKAVIETATPLPKLPRDSMPAESLFQLLVAELAASRQQYDVALFTYIQQTKLTRNPQVVARAIWFAQELDDQDTVLELSLIWAEYAPNDKEALNTACLALTRAGRWNEAFDISRRIKKLNGESLFYAIAEHAQTASDQQREHLLAGYAGLLQEHPGDEELLVGSGLLLLQQGKLDEALEYAQRALNFYPFSPPATLLETSLLLQLKRDSEAITKMGTYLTFYPDHIALRMQYANVLTQYDKPLAQKQFAILAEQSPKNEEVLLPLAKIAIQRKDYKTALKALNQLLDTETHLSEAHYYLGQLAESQANPTDAIFNYLQVEPGPFFQDATARLLETLIRRLDLVSARQHMNRLRARLPDQKEELFLAEAEALSAGGYLTKAKQLLSDATLGLPNSPKIMALLGWLEFRTNNYTDALRRLERAYEIEPDPITAARLGEVLWVRGSREEAQQIWQNGIANAPDDNSIRATLKRLNVGLR
jgi:tetratricopeptide (TPR) repeat protein